MPQYSSAQTHWEGSLMEGAGRTELATSEAAAFDVTWDKRVTPGSGNTNPEELLAAAHATCYSMALSHALATNGTPATSLDTSVSIGFKPGEGVTGSAITVKAVVPGLSEEQFIEFATHAKANCPISEALSIPITLDAVIYHEPTPTNT